MQLHCNFCAGRHSAATKRNCGEVWTDFKRRMYTNCLVGREGSSCSCSVVGDALAKLSLTMVKPWFVKWHLSQPWLTMFRPSFYQPLSTMVCEMAPQSTMVAYALAKLFTNHGWPCSGQAFINHGWPCSGQAFINHGQPWFVKWHLSHPWLTMLWLSFNHDFIPRLNWGAISQTMVEPWFNHG